MTRLELFRGDAASAIFEFWFLFFFLPSWKIKSFFLFSLGSLKQPQAASSSLKQPQAASSSLKQPQTASNSLKHPQAASSSVKQRQAASSSLTIHYTYLDKAIRGKIIFNIRT